jgi:GAF domain-containing protein
MPDWLHWLVTAVGSVLLLVSVALPIWQGARQATARESAESLALEAARLHNVKIHDILVPLSVMLTDVVGAAAARDRREMKQRIKQAVVDAASENIGPPRTRSCFFEYQEGSSPRKLVCNGLWRGRNDAPRHEFVAGTDAGDEVFRILDRRESKLVPDIDETPPPGMPAGRMYKTYIQTAVAAGSKPFGLLCVDALSVGDLTENDQLLLSLLAQILSCALAANDR